MVAQGSYMALAGVRFSHPLPIFRKILMLDAHAEFKKRVLEKNKDIDDQVYYLLEMIDEWQRGGDFDKVRELTKYAMTTTTFHENPRFGLCLINQIVLGIRGNDMTVKDGQEFYDSFKLYHSISGKYDFFGRDKDGFTIDDLLIGYSNYFEKQSRARSFVKKATSLLRFAIWRK